MSGPPVHYDCDVCDCSPCVCRAQPSQPQAEVTEAQKEAAYEAFYAALLSARPQAEVTEKQISVAVEVYWRESFTKTPTEAMRAALTAALSARQGGK